MQKGHVKKEAKRKCDNKGIAIQRMKLGIESIRVRCIVGVGATSLSATTLSIFNSIDFFFFSFFGFLFTQIENKLTLKINQTQFQIENEMRNKPMEQKQPYNVVLLHFSSFFR